MTRRPKGTAAAIRKANEDLDYFLMQVSISRWSYWNCLRALVRARRRLRNLGLDPQIKLPPARPPGPSSQPNPQNRRSK
jgi:hypothetical protein